MKKIYIIPEAKMLLSEQIMDENLGGLNGTIGDEGGQLSNDYFMDDEEEYGHNRRSVWDD